LSDEFVIEAVHGLLEEVQGTMRGDIPMTSQDWDKVVMRLSEATFVSLALANEKHQAEEEVRSGRMEKIRSKLGEGLSRIQKNHPS
jgi:hypothetical protein